MSAFQFLREKTLDMASQRNELENLRVLQTLILLRLMAYPDECFDVSLPPVMYADFRWTRTWQGQIWINRTEVPDVGWYQLHCWTESFRIRYDLKIATVIASKTLWVFNHDNFVRPETVHNEELADPRSWPYLASETFREPSQSGTPWDRAVAKREASLLMRDGMELDIPRLKTAPGR